MNEERITGSPSWSDPRGEAMKSPDDAAAMLRLWDVTRESSCSRSSWPRRIDDIRYARLA